MLYKTYQKAKEAIRKLGIKDIEEYAQLKELDRRLPPSPKRYYGSEWISAEDFFGDTQGGIYPTLAEATKAARNLNIKSYREYVNKRKLDCRLPRYPSKNYEDWSSWDNFLGHSSRPSSRDDYYTFIEFKYVIEKLKISSGRDYKNKKAIDPKLPKYPEYTYKKEWRGWKDLLGENAKRFYFDINGDKVYYYETYHKAKEAVHSLGIKSSSEYLDMFSADPRLPKFPYDTYRNEWISFYDFFGKRKPDKYRTYKEARKMARKLGVSSECEYQKMRHLDDRLPAKPNGKYKKEFRGWGDYLGYVSKTDKEYYGCLKEVKEAVAKLGIKTAVEYRKRYKEDPKLPSAPPVIYSEEWISYRDLLGK